MPHPAERTNVVLRNKPPGSECSRTAPIKPGEPAPASAMTTFSNLVPGPGVAAPISIPYQEPGTPGVDEVNVIGLAAVPTATRLPNPAARNVPTPSWIVTPGSRYSIEPIDSPSGKRYGTPTFRKRALSGIPPISQMASTSLKR